MTPCIPEGVDCFNEDSADVKGLGNVRLILTRLTTSRLTEFMQQGI